ncbi:MAG: hypothetical protein A2896_00490 [Candidatus Nealsonbacteria bacterium RIFCSPLOWO2_01_FULL_43_32]|uniref:Adenylate kinase n=1 Tax=Candidatus Nealsonbacteria bacterium RIFCSPLOWO2_01_FULL_43_32 TaxID=1801672 RepID=A0A1G2EH48_9BACT|nr:MAG: hypothetical protein A2896_00490 [Candidatus Nealsonbacteria bacterium RIFCSPLOWO2_01_FULL_43_32]
MAKIIFPVFKTKVKGLAKTFDLNNPKERGEYFKLKVGAEIKKLKAYFAEGHTFIAYLLGKKNSGKGTYAKMFAEAVDPSKIEHFSIGDMVRGIDQELKDKNKKKGLIEFLEKNYRGRFSNQKIIALLEKRSTAAPLLPTELILALVKREIAKKKKKTIFLDGFPRDMDQINFTLFFRDLVGYRDDPDVFVLINVPEKVIDERMKYRRVCPRCQTSRNLKLLPTSKISYDAKRKEFHLICDNPQCQGAKLVKKEGDEKGTKPIRARLLKDEELIQQAASLYGIPKVFLRNSIPQSLASTSVDDYEITPEYSYQWDGKKVQVKEKSWTVSDDEGIPSYSLLAAPVVVSLLKQMVKVLGL